MFKIKMHVINEDAQILNLKYDICGVFVPQIDFKKIIYSVEDFKVLLSFLKRSKEDRELYDNIKDIIYYFKTNRYDQVEMIFAGAVYRTDIFKFVFRIPYEYVPLFINSTEEDVTKIYAPWRLKIGK